MTTEPENSFVNLMRAELTGALANLELRLVDRFASKADYQDLNKRVDKLESINDGKTALSTWQRWAIGGVLFAAVNAVVYVTLYHYFH